MPTSSNNPQWRAVKQQINFQESQLTPQLGISIKLPVELEQKVNKNSLEARGPSLAEKSGIRGGLGCATINFPPSTSVPSQTDFRKPQTLSLMEKSLAHAENDSPKHH